MDYKKLTEKERDEYKMRRSVLSGFTKAKLQTIAAIYGLERDTAQKELETIKGAKEFGFVQRRIDRVAKVEVIRVDCVAGVGVSDDMFRYITEYWTLDGERIAVIDDLERSSKNK